MKDHPPPISDFEALIDGAYLDELDAIARKIEECGGSVTGRLKNIGMIVGSAPKARFDEIAKIKGIRQVTPPGDFGASKRID